MRARTLAMALLATLPAAGASGVGGPAPGAELEHPGLALLAAAAALAAGPDAERALEFHAALDAGQPVDLDPGLPARHGGLSAELRLVLERAGTAPGPWVDAGLASLGSLPPELAEALAGLARAHLEAWVLTERAFAAGPRPDPRTLAEAKVVLVRAAAEALPALAPGPYRGLDVCGAVLLELEGRDSDHACDYAFAVDLGGRDVWRNNAGGNVPHAQTCATVAALTSGMDPPTVAFALDLAGDDLYAGAGEARGVAGGACNGLGALVDVAGDDAYDTAVVHEGGANGGANFGGGLLLDLAGDDRYTGRVARAAPGTVPASGGANGGANFGGHGDLLDLGGRDAYDGSIDQQGGLNGGENDGSGFLLDCGPEDDTYDGQVGLSGGVNGGSSLGRGALVDCGGDDRYQGTIGTEERMLQALGTSALPHGGVNGGAAALSQGLLLDLGGDDLYAGEVWGNGGVQGGAHDAAALLADAAGDDRYAGAVHVAGGVNGAAGRGGSAALLDLAGDDAYVGLVEGTGGVNGGAVLGAALLWDAGGDDAYDGAALGRWCSELLLGVLPTCGGPVNGGGESGVGFLVDAGGRDRYRDDPAHPWGEDETRVKGTGAQLDLPG